MNDNFDDQLSRQLASLNSDLSGAKLPGAGAARQRAAQRTRHQVTGGLVAGVAVVAIGAIGIIQPDFRADTTPQPAETPTVNSTDPVELPDGVLLTAEDVAGDTGIEWQAVDPGETFACVPAAPDDATKVHYDNSENGKLDQFVETPANPSERFAEIQAVIESCIDNLSQQDKQYRLDQAWTIHDLGDEAWMASYWAPLLAPDEYAGAAIVQVRLVRNGEYLVVVADGGPAQDFNGTPSPERAQLATAKLCAVAEVSCPGQLNFTRIFPPVIGDLDGWLSAEQVSITLSLAQLTEGSEVRPVGGWGYVGLPVEPDGARSVENRVFGNMVDSAGVSVTETVARFDDADVAQAHFEELVAAADSFSQEGDVIENTGTVSGDGYEGVTWRSHNAEFNTTFVYGAVVVGDAVATVVHMISDYEGRDVTADQLARLMSAAGERLGQG